MSRVLSRFFRTRVSRRLFVLFVLSAFIPLAAVGFLSMAQVRMMLLQQGDQRLAATAKSYGMTLFEHLQLASEVAVAAAAQDGAIPADSLAQRAFSWLAVRNSKGEVRRIFGSPWLPDLTKADADRLASGKPVATVVERRGGSSVVMAAPFGPVGSAVVFGELRHAFLWGLEDELPAGTSFCVIEEGSRRRLHCPVAIGEGDLASIAPTEQVTIGASTWKLERDTYRARSWAQFMRAGFGTPDWIVVASQNENHQLARAKEFVKIYVPVIALTLLLVMWLTIRQSRNIVQPVELLAERARSVARNDFDTRLGLKREDEFGELGNAFDHMSLRLGRQFASLTALGEIDRLILSTQDTAQVIRTVLQRLNDMLPSDLVTITLLDNDNATHARTYFRPPDNPGSVAMEREAMSQEDRVMLESVEGKGHWVDLAGGIRPAAYLKQAAAQGLANVFVQPIVWRGTVCGALVLGYRAHTQLDPEERQRAHEIADRVAVAVSSAWRDEQLYVQAHYDALTGLPNRLLFKDRLGREIVRSQRENLQFGLLFVDLDHFKNVNDSYGHTVGDAILREAARRISRCIRDADTVSRLGGDEFTVLLTGLHHPQEAWLIAETMVALLSQEYTVGEQKCFLSASIGIASYPADGRSVEELQKSADTAMYRAKASGRAQAIFYEERMNAETVARLTLDRDLRAAIERDELVLHYQPQVDLRTGAISGAEALVRWNHPVHGLVSPARFIALAEESGFIDQIGQWTLQQACAQMRRWRDRGVAPDRVAVNVSPRQFRRRNLVDFIAQVVAEAGLPAACLEIEITEGLLLDRGEAIEGMLRELGEAGHGIALDDFGTGFSSMSYLKRLPVDTIKIDRAFIEGLERSADSEAIVAAIIAMSHALGKTVVAEGVETAEQRALLRKLRCDEIQGFFIAPALPPEDFERLMTERLNAPAVA